MAIRGGFGIFFDRPEGNIIATTPASPPFQVLSQYENGNLASITGGPQAPLTPWGTIQAIDPNLKNPYTMNFSLSVQREIRGGMFVEGAYVGNLGRHLLRQPDINQVPFDRLAANAQLPAAERLAVNAMRQFRGFSEIRSRLSDSTSNYHGLQLHTSKRKGAFLFTGNYTFSKVLTDASGTAENPEDYTNRHYNYGPATFDRNHILVGTATYQFGKLIAMPVVARAALGGWELSGIARRQSGAPLTISANTSTGTRRADYVRGEATLASGSRSAALWFNTSAFAAPANDRRGTSGVGIVRGPSLSLIDLSMRKNFPLSDRVNLRIQIDAFNALNWTNYLNVAVNVSQPGAGSINSAGSARSLQLAAKINF
jgi:hypothetical protein